jgi:hypothetical protein
MNNMEKNKFFKECIDSIKIDLRSPRELYEDSIAFRYNDKVPMELREHNIRRIMVNDARHKIESGYTQTIKAISKMDKYNRQRNYTLYKNNVLLKIAEAYPFLEQECRSQMRREDMVRIVNNKKKHYY